jgi:hypothetical protein
MNQILTASLVACGLAFASATVAAQNGQEEGKRKVPKDSVEVSVTGCLKGRVLQVSDVRRTDTETGPPVRQRSLRLAGKKDVMKQVKESDGHYVALIGLIRKADLVEPGVKFKGGRVVIGGGMGSPGAIPSPVENVAVLDVSTLVATSGECR